MPRLSVYLLYIKSYVGYRNGDKKCQDYNKFKFYYLIYYLTVFKALVYASVSPHRSYPLKRTTELSVQGILLFLTALNFYFCDTVGFTNHLHSGQKQNKILGSHGTQCFLTLPVNV